MPTNEYNNAPSTAQEDLGLAQQDPVIFVAIDPPGADRQWYAQTGLPHGSNYYGGWKDDRLLDISDVRRSLAGPSSDYEVGTFQVELADDDYAIRTHLTAAEGRFYSKWEIDAYMATPSGMGMYAEALHLATGLVDTDPEFDTRDRAMTVKLSCRDRLGVAMGWTLTGQTTLPRRALNDTTLPGIVSAANGLAAWLPWGTLSNNIVIPSGFAPPFPDGIESRGSSLDGAYWSAGFAPWSSAVTPVTNLALSGTVGGDMPEREYAIQVFPVDASNNVGDPTPYINGDTTFTIAAPDQILHVEWDASPEATKYYVVLSAFYYSWRPQQIIETTGLSVDFDHAFDTPSAGTGFSTGAVEVPNTPFNYYSARAKEGTVTSDWHEEYDETLYPEQFGISITLPNDQTRPLRFYWTPNGSSGYQVKKRAAGPSTPKIFTMLPSQLEDGLVYWDEDWEDGDALPTTEAADRAAGRVKALYTRDVVLNDGETWRELFLAGCAIKGVDDWYYDAGGEASVEVNEDDGVSFLFPKDGTTFDTILPTRYKDVLGSDAVTRRFTFGYARGTKGDLLASGTSIISVNLQGIEDAGDGSGEVVTDLHDQLKLFLNQFVLASGEGYTTGLWGPNPTQGFGGEEIVNGDSFDEVRDMRAAELDGGIVGAGVTGALGEFVDVAEEMKRWMVSGDFRLGPNRDWQIVCRAIDTSLSPLFVTELLTDEFNIQTRTFKPTPRLSELQNLFTYRSSRDYVDTGWLVDDQAYVNQTSIDNWNIRRRGEDLDFAYIEDSSVVGHILGKHTARRENAPMYAVLEGGMQLLSPEYDIGRYFGITHWRGVGSSGWEDRVMWILSSTFIPSTRRVLLECLDVTDIIADNTGLLEGLMDIELGGSWYNSPELTTSPQTVDAYEYWDKRFPWTDFPDGTTLTARIWGAVPSGVSMTCHLYDPDTLTVVATDPTPFTSATFELHTFLLPSETADRQYRLRAIVSGGVDLGVNFKGMLRPDLP